MKCRFSSLSSFLGRRTPRLHSFDIRIADRTLGAIVTNLDPAKLRFYRDGRCMLSVSQASADNGIQPGIRLDRGGAQFP